MRQSKDNKFSPIKLIDIELSLPLKDLLVSKKYQSIMGLVRLKGVPLGYVNLPLKKGFCSAENLLHESLKTCHENLLREFIRLRLSALSTSEQWTWQHLLSYKDERDKTATVPLLTVAVCTRDRSSDLRICLQSLRNLTYSNLDIIIVDNAPTNSTTKKLVIQNFPDMRYVLEPRPGLSWARNRAIVEAKGEIIAFTDDDAVVDPGWAEAIAAIFVEDSSVLAVTGLVVPNELETEAQYLFEAYDGFGRGFRRKWHLAPFHQKGNIAFFYGGTGGVGTGANMAFRSNAFKKLGYFDTALGAGTFTNGAEDLEIFFRIIKEKYTIVYEPGAIVRHNHRKSYAALKQQLTDWGRASTSYLVRTWTIYPDERFSVIAQWFGRLFCRNIPRLIGSFFLPTSFIRALIWRELIGSFSGLGLYKKSTASLPEIETQYGNFSEKTPHMSSRPRSPSFERKSGEIFKRDLEVSKPIHAIDESENFNKIELTVRLNDRKLGCVMINNAYKTLSVTRIKEAIITKFGQKLLPVGDSISPRRIIESLHESRQAR